MLTHSTLNRFAHPVVQALVDAIFPPACRVCGKLFEPPSQQLETAPPGPVSDWVAGGSKAVFQRCFNEHFTRLVCRPCRERFVPVHSPICPACGLMFTSRQGEDHLCGRCLQKRFAFGRARAVGTYEQALLQLIHQLKYKRRMELVRPLSRLMALGAQYFFDGSGLDMVVPVPMHPRKLRRRGFNPAALLARASMQLVTSKWRSCQVVEGLLYRKHETESQTGLRRPERWENVRGAFAVRDGAAVRLKNKHLLLVDDVMTTGATADTCARALLRGGAGDVDVLTLAQAP